MKSRNFPQRAAGFSLIEVMVAIVIISIGLLALASLQLSLIRSSSETKAQSVGMALAKQRLEELASYNSMAAYRAIADQALADVPGNPIGGVNYQRRIQVTRYVYDKAAVGAVKYVPLTNDADSDAAIKAIDPDYLPGREFKRVVATVQWVDAAGAIQRVRVEDAISAIEPADTIAVNKNKDYGAARKAVSIISNPASVAGVIPIAIGNGTDTAATNPRPILLSQGSSTTLVETRFDIFTYAALNSTTATAQSRVETSVVGCTCRTASGTGTTFRPTYWNGSKYTSPDTRSGTPNSAPKSGVDQSNLCTACCRDHQDPSGVTGPKFDPRRSTHNHYLASNLTTAVTMSTPNNDYNEACRLIRVDGVFRAAADTYNDYFGLLATAGLNQSSPTTTVAGAVPGSTQTTNYQTFVLNYLHSRFITGAQANYNVPLNWATVTGNSALDNPGTASISSSSTPQYLHSRGVYIDYLTDEVKQMIHDAGLAANCLGTDNAAADTPAEFQACVFKLVPFTSINLTEIAGWAATQPTKVDVENNGFKLTINSQFPVKGKSVLKVGASNGDTSTGNSTIQRSSAGLAVAEKVFPDSELNESYVPNMLTDANNQDFQVGTVVTPPSNEKIWMILTGSDMLAGVAYGPGNAPQTGFLLSNSACTADENTSSDGVVASDLDSVTANDSSTKPDEFRCVPDAGNPIDTGVTTTVTVSNYNRLVAGGVTVPNSCRGNTTTTTMPYAKDFDILTATANTLVTPGVDGNSDGDFLDVGDTAPVYTSVDLGTGTVSNPDRPGAIVNSGEYTTFTLTITNLARLQFDFGTFVYKCPSNWSTFITNGGAWINLNNPAKVANCSEGNGNSPSNVPLWSSTYGACPTGFTPFN